ncbi:YifB family Mg chelatase-like AAA ATPase [Patescibacteria group bacterium]|nr:YifB family Mg chelatase-like AAA ATPase [Patescibacteria group bacterium]MBU4141530.1 YifB family Mg chelatase-like AAA ATPase [Patescibacteria group bacterium]MBU4338014.1 YifB family Mg chelatase-like AAA ATPase [Patescibacteria group bacterium]MBU4580401.1 YifB family Mg chelatase-like AAA ATPase [Patescibacteria group bacterium]
MISKINSSAVWGLDGIQIEAEVDITPGLAAITVVGLPDAAVQESKERIKSAIKNSGFRFPHSRITINLAPADIKKEGPSYDLPIAVGVMAASGQLEKINLEDSVFVGELALNGALRHVAGVLPIAIFAKSKGFKKLYIPKINALEASLISGLEIFPVENFQQLIMHLIGKAKINPFKPPNFSFKQKINTEVNMAFIKGQAHAKRALEIAASGAHNVIMSGPPGSGKTLLARSMPSIMPPLNEKEAIEVIKIYSISGTLSSANPFAIERPFRSPHHSASAIALVGGGQFPRPGEISLAHRGILFLDELPEFPRALLESLRQPLEDGMVTISRAQGSLSFPAKFSLIASMNPCPCGFFGNPHHECSCSFTQINKYQKKISGPLLDRIDLFVEVPEVKTEHLTSDALEESSEKIRERVMRARLVQEKRFANKKISANSEMTPEMLKKFSRLEDDALMILARAMDQFHLSARSYHRVIKIGRTIADLAGSDKIKIEHIAEALQYRAKAQER